jgi:hypothetical protein
MAMKMGRNTSVCALVLGFGLTSPMVAQGACFDTGCSASPPPLSTHAGSGSSTNRSGESLAWDFKSNYRYKVGVQFYSQTRKGHVWPKHDEMWVLNDYATHTFRIGCERGEKICFGAWSIGDGGKTYWGVGDGNKYGCTTCCHTCGDNPRRSDLD